MSAWGWAGVMAIRSAFVLAFLFLAFRLLGKRQAAQLNVYDLAMIIALANAVQNAMTAGRGELAVGLATSTTLLLVAYAITLLLVRLPSAQPRIVGSPAILVNHGRVLWRRMRAERVTRDELLAALREHGVQHTNEAELAVLEVDGSISVVPAEGSGS